MSLCIVRNPNTKNYDDDSKNIPLKSQDYYVKVTGRDAEIAITQKFFNEEDNRVEAYYKFPLPAETAVHSFEARNDDGQVIVATCKEKNKAKEEYNDAIEKGHTAYYMDRDDGHTFSIAVGGLSAKTGVTITIKIACELLNEGDFQKVRLIIPLTIGERYSPRYDTLDNALSNVHPSKQEKKPYDMTITGDIYMTGKLVDASYYGRSNVDIKNREGYGYTLTSIDSQTHKIKLSKMTENSAHFEIRDLQELTQDVVLVIERETSETVAYCQTLPETVELKNSNLRHCTSVNIVPDFSKCPQPNMNDAEYVLCLDISGSMASRMNGEYDYSGSSYASPSRLTVCKQAAKQFVGLIPNGATFRIVTFDDRFDECQLEGSTLVEKKKFATNWIDNIKSRGGTELYPALEYILEKTNPKKNTLVILITDGEITNDTDVFRLVKKNPSATIFTLGIGDSVSQNLVKGIAVRGNGQAAFVGSGETGEKDVLVKVRNLLALAKSSLRKNQSDYQLVFKCESPVICLPESGCPLYEKVDNTFYVFSETPLTSIELHTYEGENRTPSLQTIVPVTIEHADFLLHKIGGIKLIDTLEAQEKSKAEKAAKPSGSLLRHMQVPDKSDDVLKDMIVSVSTDLGVLSRLTAYIAVEKKVDPDTSKTVLREVPLQAKKRENHGMMMECCAMSMSMPKSMAPRAMMAPLGVRGVSGGPGNCGPTGSMYDNSDSYSDENADLGGGLYGGGGYDEFEYYTPPSPKTNVVVTKPKENPVPSVVLGMNLNGCSLSTNLVTSEANESLLDILKVLGLSHVLEVGHVIELRNQADPNQNGFYEVVSLGSVDEPWLLQLL